MPTPAQSPEVVTALLADRLDRHGEIMSQFSRFMETVNQKLGQLATSEQVGLIHRELVEALTKQSQEVAALQMIIHGPSTQPETGLLSQVGLLRAKADINDRRWERVIGYMLGAAAAGGGIGAFLHSLLTMGGK